MKEQQTTNDLVKEHGVFRVKKAANALNKFRKLYNKLCRKCQNKVFVNSKMPLSEYCEKCQEKIKEIKL